MLQPGPQLPTSPYLLRRIPFERGLDALRLAAGAWPPEERAGQLAVLAEQVRAGRESDFVLVEARAEGVLAGAALAQSLAGRAAVVWRPQIADHQRTSRSLVGELWQMLHAELATGGVHLAQSLLGADDRASRAEFLASGYLHAGDLLYMAAIVGDRRRETYSTEEGRPEVSPTLIPYRAELHDSLAQIVAATYGGSLDCPQVDGLRTTADVVAGYRAVGEFRPELWLLVRSEDRDAGCLLLADHPDGNQLEIVYLGLTPEVRGRGWGRRLTGHALDVARGLGRARVVLAVDAANWPAIAMYEAFGFVAWDRRSVLVRDLRVAASSGSETT
jgi:mycothiol synthase